MGLIYIDLIDVPMSLNYYQYHGAQTDVGNREGQHYYVSLMNFRKKRRRYT